MLHTLLWYSRSNRVAYSAIRLMSQGFTRSQSKSIRSLNVSRYHTVQQMPPLIWDQPGMTVRHSSSGYTTADRGDPEDIQNEEKQLCESTLLLQEGTDIEEVPVAVIRESLENKRNNDASRHKPFVQLKAEEEAAFVEGFKNFHSPKEVLSMLHTIPSQEVTPVVALSIIRKLFEVENNFVFRNDGKSWVIATESSSPDTFARKAIVDRLVDVIILGDDASVLLDALDMLRSDRKGIATNVIRLSEDSEDEYMENRNPILLSDMFEFSRYRSKLCEQILIWATKGRLSLEQLCRAVCTIGKISILFPGEVEPELIDKMWAGFSEKSNRINESNIAEIFQTIQYFKQSQRLVMRIAERKLLNLYWKIKTDAVAQICDHLLMKETRSDESRPYWGVVSARLLSSISKIVHVNLHELTEEQLVKVTKAFYALDYYDHIFEKTLTKYMKARCLKLSNPATLSVVMDYVKKNRIRSRIVLDAVAEYLVSHHSTTSGQSISPTQLSSLLTPFGYLDHQPAQGHKFWEVVERLLSENFFDLPPKDLVDSLLSFIYLQKYPLNFVSRIFSTYFLDRLHTSETDITVLQQARSNLKLLDAALTLECGPKYQGPYLPRDFTAKSIFVDGRITRMRTLLQDSLTKIFSPASYKIESSVILPNLPLHPLYIVDILISPKTGSVIFESLESYDVNTQGTTALTTERSNELHPQVALRNRYNLRHLSADRFFPIHQSSDYTAILINIPEHFASDGKNLLGPQVMRIRHLNLLGFTVVNLSSETLMALRGTPQALIDYLSSEINN